MSIVTIRGLDPEVKRQLVERARRNGRSMEAEIREILTIAAEAPAPSMGLGDRMRAALADLPAWESEWGWPDFEASRDRTPPKAIEL